jgi:hypothetical protein
MKVDRNTLLVVSAAATLAATVCGCQSGALKTDMSKAERAEFQQKVARDPFPTARQDAVAGG